jgi:hypothetical protein
MIVSIVGIEGSVGDWTGKSVVEVGVNSSVRTILSEVGVSVEEFNRDVAVAVASTVGVI